VVFVHDATGSQQPYLDSARQYVRNRVALIGNSLKPGATARYRVVAFRDHREQGDLWTVHDSNEFTTDTAVLEKQLGALVASGGGDGPEAQFDALDAVLRSSWRQNVNRIVIMITDSSPHGIGEPGDVVPASHPDSITADSVLESYKMQKTRLFVVGCIPTINYYKNAVTFYKKLSKATGGDYIELANPSRDSGPMDRAIVGAILNASDSLRIENRWEDWIVGNSDRGHASLVADMHAKLSAEGEQCHEVACTEHGGHDVKYHTAPITRARVDAIVGRTLSYQKMVQSDPLMNNLFG